MAARTYRGINYLQRPDGSTTESWFDYVCGHCGNAVGGFVVAYYDHKQGGEVCWLLCTVCGFGSVRNPNGTVQPGLPYGPLIEGLPADVEAAYEEARRCMSVSAYAAAELLCRNLLMHVAVDKGAKEGASFASYLDHLRKAGYITPPMDQWVEVIREHGNRAAHTLEPSDRERAEGTVWFSAMLLRLTYETAARAERYGRPDAQAGGTGGAQSKAES